MATTTENLGLTLPAGTDRALVSDLNENFQTLDAFAGQATADIQEAQETANAAAPQATTYTKTEVDAAIGGKISLEDILGVGADIASNTDMDVLTGIGKWYCVNGQTAATVTNAPFTDAAYFGWTIRSVASSNRYVQIAIKNSDDFVIAKRRYSGVWGTWSYLTGTAVT